MRTANRCFCQISVIKSASNQIANAEKCESEPPGRSAVKLKARTDGRTRTCTALFFVGFFHSCDLSFLILCGHALVSQEGNFRQIRPSPPAALVGCTCVSILNADPTRVRRRCIERAKMAAGVQRGSPRSTRYPERAVRPFWRQTGGSAVWRIGCRSRIRPKSIHSAGVRSTSMPHTSLFSLSCPSSVSLLL